MSDRQFILEQDVTEGAPAGYTSERDRAPVSVQLAGGEVHRFWEGTYVAASDDPGSRARFEFGSSYDVHPSGALAVVGWRVWHEGWPALMNDTEHIVATYGPHEWTRVTGRCATDPFRVAMEDRRDAALKRRGQETDNR